MDSQIELVNEWSIYFSVVQSNNDANCIVVYFCTELFSSPLIVVSCWCCYCPASLARYYYPPTTTCDPVYLINFSVINQLQPKPDSVKCISGLNNLVDSVSGFTTSWQRFIIIIIKSRLVNRFRVPIVYICLMCGWADQPG